MIEHLIEEVTYSRIQVNIYVPECHLQEYSVKRYVKDIRNSEVKLNYKIFTRFNHFKCTHRDIF